MQRWIGETGGRYPRRRSRIIVLSTVCFALVVFSLAIPLSGQPTRAAATGLTLVVTSNLDIPDPNPANGVCDIGNGDCTLRAAIQTANAIGGADTIILQANTTYLLTRPGDDFTALDGDLDVRGDTTILGAGPGSTIIDGNGAVINDRVFEISGTVTISGISIRNGYAVFGFNGGGGVVNRRHLTISNSELRGNDAAVIGGGAIANYGTLTLTKSVVLTNTTSTNAAGGIYNGSYATLRLFDSTVRGNTANVYGGGSFNDEGFVGIVNSTIAGNLGAIGGGAYVTATNPGHGSNATFTMVNSTVSGNRATIGGGGIYVDFGTAALYNSTVARNLANSDGVGSGVGGGVVNSSRSTFTFINTIIAENNKIAPGPLLLPDDCAGTLTSQGFNILYDTSASFCIVNGAHTLVWPGLLSLASNGGATETHALSDTSPAVNAGHTGGCLDNNGAPVSTDQRGNPRPGRCDVGSFEYVLESFLPLIRR